MPRFCTRVVPRRFLRDTCESWSCRQQTDAHHVCELPWLAASPVVVLACALLCWPSRSVLASCSRC